MYVFFNVRVCVKILRKERKKFLIYVRFCSHVRQSYVTYIAHYSKSFFNMLAFNKHHLLAIMLIVLRRRRRRRKNKVVE